MPGDTLEKLEVVVVMASEEITEEELVEVGAGVEVAVVVEGEKAVSAADSTASSCLGSGKSSPSRSIFEYYFRKNFIPDI